MIEREFLMRIRSLVIQLLNTIDDALGLPRTILDKNARRQIRRDVIK